MSKYEEGKGKTGICPFCEKPVASYENDKEFETRLTAADDDDNDPELQSWASQYCWYGWSQPGECRNGMLIDERLIEALDQRDEKQAEVERLSAMRNELLAEMEVDEERYDAAIAALKQLIVASNDATTEIRDRSFARKPLIRAIEQAQRVLEP